MDRIQLIHLNTLINLENIMTVSIDQAAEDFKRDIDKFVEAYKAKHSANQSEYPLVLPDNNSGLWIEFMLDFHTKGIV